MGHPGISMIGAATLVELRRMGLTWSDRENNPSPAYR